MTDHSCRHTSMAQAAALLLLLATAPAPALINVQFTPVDLARQSKTIVRLELKMTDAKGGVSAVSHECLRGQLPAAPTFTAGAEDIAAMRDLRKAFGEAETAVAVLFAGDFSGARREDDLAAKSKMPSGAMIVGTTWFGLFDESEGKYRIARDPLDLRAVWAGSAVMLERAVRYALADDAADVPVRSGAAWARATRAGAVSSPHGCLAVDLAQNGKPGLFVLAGEGDRLFFGPESGSAAGTTLPSESRLAAWSDLNGDGRLDLASWNGDKLLLYIADGDGKFHETPAGVSVPAGCRSLSATDAGLVLGTPSGLTLVRPAQGGGFRVDDIRGSEDASGGPALAGDFDNDGWADIVQAGPAGLVLYHGNEKGGFDAPAEASRTRPENPPQSLFSGDFDADGLLDVGVAAEDGPLLFWNMGAGQFREVANESGELVYIGKPGALGGSACDINHDGRQDILLFYEAMEPQIFFNRGFCCFGYARNLEPDTESLPQTDALLDGQRGGAVADLDGDGGQDMACATPSGDIVVLFLDTGKGRKPGLTVALKGVTGPLNVTAYDEDRCLGTRIVTAGSPVFYGKRDPGPLRLEWQFPGSPIQSREVILLKPETLILSPDPAQKHCPEDNVTPSEM